jgi:acetyl-CoA carboxylase biotin carboxyl carrier protein
MNQKELKELIEFIIEKGIAEYELERGEVKVRIKRASATPAVAIPDTRFVAVQTPLPVAADPLVHAPKVAETALPAASEPKPEENLHIVHSPIVGTFYEAPSPGAPPFVKVGEKLEVGQVLCIVEAMKLMNEIECDVAGELVKILVSNGQPIEYGQELFAVRVAK